MIKGFHLLLAALLLSASIAASGQQSAPASTPTGNDDILILVNLTADELKFDAVPSPKVEFPGTPERVTVWVTDRQNLPEKVQPGVTYRNIGIQLRISSRFADIERIVQEALGEIPVNTGESPAAPPQQQ